MTLRLMGLRLDDEGAIIADLDSAPDRVMPAG